MVPEGGLSPRSAGSFRPVGRGDRWCGVPCRTVPRAPGPWSPLQGMPVRHGLAPRRAGAPCRRSRATGGGPCGPRPAAGPLPRAESHWIRNFSVPHESNLKLE